jgi:hypothetical protein
VFRCSPRILQARRSEQDVRARTAGRSSRRARGPRVFFERDLEDALLQQEVGDHLLNSMLSLSSVRRRWSSELVIMPSCFFQRKKVGAVILSYRQISVWLRPASCSRMARTAPPSWRFLPIRCAMFRDSGWVGNPRAISSAGTY